MGRSLAEGRRELREAIIARGRRHYNVWTGFAPKGNIHFSLDGTPNADHLIWMEGDPEVVSYTIPTKTVVGQGSEAASGTVPDAICILRSGQVEWREIKTDYDARELRLYHTDQVLSQTSAAEKYGAHWRLIDTSEINNHRQLISNWHQGISFIGAAADFDLRPYQHDVMFVVGDEYSTTLANITGAYDPKVESLLVAAFFRLIQLGKLESDLATKQLGMETIVRRRPIQ